MRTFKLSILILLITMSQLTNAQNNKGALTPDILNRLKASYKASNYHKAVSHAVQNNDIKKLAYTQANKLKYDDHFTYKVTVKNITDQKQSGRCWMFTSLNTVRPIVIDKLNLDKFEFSSNYLYFYDQLEKANLFLEAIIKTAEAPDDDRTVKWLYHNAIGDGGVWNLFVNLVEKYGLIPKEAMPETHASENTSWLSRMLRNKLREDGYELREMYRAKKDYKTMEARKIEQLKDIYKMLVIALGEPPTEFTWSYTDHEGKKSEEKKYTPKSFYDEMIGKNLDDYILFMDDPTRPYNKLYEIEYDRNVYEGRNWKFINLPADELKPMLIASLKNKEAMYFSCDVGKQLDRDNGVLSMQTYDFGSLFDVQFGMDKKARIITGQSGSSHGMALVGVDLDENGKVKKWLLENSWGPTAGHNGYLIMTDPWFDNYMFRIVVDKAFIPEKYMKILKQKPTMLPPWDPMFKNDN